MTTLEDARDLMLSLPALHRENAHWRYAAELLLKAADRQEKYAVMDARAQMTRALTAEGLSPAKLRLPLRGRPARAGSRLRLYSASV